MTTTGWPAVHLTDVDGVRTVWADVPGPLRAGLILRVGSADETLVTAGITHLLEHLALFGIGRPGDHSNGFVDHTVTVFHCVGDDHDVRQFMGNVTRQLATPPTARIQDERGVLRAEQAGRRQSTEDVLLAWRYGAVGFGLPAQTQYGIEHVAADDVREWAARHATKGNAVLWLSGPPPGGLRLALPDGAPVPAPDPTPAMLPALPAWFRGPDRLGVGVHSVIERTHANPALAQILQDRLVDELRVRQAVAYAPQTDYRALALGSGRLLALTDLVDGRQTDAVRLFMAALADLGDGARPTDAEMEAWRRTRERSDAEALAPLGFVATQAWNLALGHPMETVEESAAQRAAVTPDDVALAARRALASAVAAVPEGVRLTREPWVEAPGTVHKPLSGREVAHAEAPEVGETLVLASAGLTWRSGNTQVTVPMDRAAAVLHWADGRRVVVADDASRVTVEPTMWRDGGAVVAHVDSMYPAQLRIDMGERPLNEIPRPRPVASTPPATPEPPQQAVGASAASPGLTTHNEREPDARRVPGAHATQNPRPWWRRRPGLLALAVLVVAVLAPAAAVSAWNGRGTVFIPVGVAAIWTFRQLLAERRRDQS